MAEAGITGYLKGVKQMVKIIGVILIIMSCWGAGISSGRDMRARAEALKNHISALQLIKAEILFKSAPMESIIALLEKECSAKTAGFYRDTYRRARVGATFSQAAIEYYPLLKAQMLNKGDIEAIKSVCSVLGRYDASTQSETITAAISCLQGRLEEASAESLSKGRLYKTLGAAAGIVLALMAI